MSRFRVSRSHLTTISTFIFVGIWALLFYVPFYHSSALVRTFFENAKVAFQNSDQVPIRDLTSFDWDTVCFIPEYDLIFRESVPDHIVDALGEDPLQDKRFVASPQSVGLRAALVFSANGRINTFLAFKKGIATLTYFGDLAISRDDTTYTLLTTGEASCASRASAALTVVPSITSASTSGDISFTSSTETTND